MIALTSITPTAAGATYCDDDRAVGDGRGARPASLTMKTLLYGLTVLSLTTVWSTVRLEASTAPCPPYPVSHQPAERNASQPVKDALTIATLNLAGDARIPEVVAAWANARSLDVLLLQEVGHDSIDGHAFAAAIGERLGFHVLYAPAYPLSATATQGLAIVSRYPLHDVRVDPLEYHHLLFRARCRVALWATATTPDGPVRLVNVHLDTRINSRVRQQQLTPVLDRLAGGVGPQIVGGDFNTLNIGWVQSVLPLPFLQRQTSAVRTLLAARGFSTPFGDTPSTFPWLGLPLRLDWLYLKHIEAIDWRVDDVRYSDHRGIWAHLRLRQDARQAGGAVSDDARQTD